MEKSKIYAFCHLIIVFFFLGFPFICSSQHHSDPKVYIVHMDAHLTANGSDHQSSLHLDVLERVVGRRATEVLYYSYKSFNAFAAQLTEHEMQQLAGVEGVVNICPSKKMKLHTTRSWDFIGFSKHVQRGSVESEVIIGVFDSGIWPESPSFSDEGFGPPPARWKGICQSSPNFTCNRKIIGARYYRRSGIISGQDYLSPRDANGHGTHTASTAAGGLVRHANLEGFAAGTARGAVPSARIAVYKVCWQDAKSACDGHDIYAAFDDAILDGVDIISASLGGYDGETTYLNDPIAIGSFHAMQHGILTSTSAGNDGPYLSSISNFSPWALSVAANTIDRRFVTSVLLGNNLMYQGVSINTFELNNRFYPLIYGGDAPNAAGRFNSSVSRYCIKGSIDKKFLKGKIVLCDLDSKGKRAISPGTAAGILIRDGCKKDSSSVSPLPASCVGLRDGNRIEHYIHSASNASATIQKSTEVPDFMAPFVVSFSSRGPDPVNNELLKPDLAAPGVYILAAWPRGIPPSEVPGDPRKVDFNIISGTSMACPHATGAAAYVKSFHPKWSPAAIKSALMTTAFQMNPTANWEAEYAYGAGNINPLGAVNPGLVYDAGEKDYVNFLCSQGYDTKVIRLVTREDISCPRARKAGGHLGLNLPSFAISAQPSRPFHRAFKRIVTNIGTPPSTYVARVAGPPGIKIEVKPRILSFQRVGQMHSFEVTIAGKIKKEGIFSGSLVWEDGQHSVRSPILFQCVMTRN